MMLLFFKDAKLSRVIRACAPWGEHFSSECIAIRFFKILGVCLTNRERFLFHLVTKILKVSVTDFGSILTAALKRFALMEMLNGADLVQSFSTIQFFGFHFNIN